MARTGVVLNVDVNALWQELIPFQGVGLVVAVIFAAYMGVMEKKRGPVCILLARRPSFLKMEMKNLLMTTCLLMMRPSCAVPR